MVEHFLDTEGVRGSNPLSRTISPAKLLASRSSGIRFLTNLTREAFSVAAYKANLPAALALFQRSLAIAESLARAAALNLCEVCGETRRFPAHLALADARSLAIVAGLSRRVC